MEKVEDDRFNMKIAYYSAYPLNFHNASANRMRYFLKELQRKFEVDLFLPLLPQVKNTRPLWWRLFRESFSGIELSIRLILPKHKLIILSSPPYVTILMAALSLSLLKRKFILDIRDPYPEVFFELKLFSSSSVLGKILKSLTKFTFMRSSGIVAATKGIKEIIESYDINKNVHPFFNGFDPSIFYPRNITDKFKRFTLVYHGTLARMQNVDLLIQVANSCPEDIDILVAGAGPKEEKIKQEKRINYLGSLSYKDVANVVTKSHVGLSFMNEELIGKISFPSKVFEYIGSGLPVISTPYTEAGDFLEKNKLGFQFKNNELDKIFEKINFLKCNYRTNTPDYNYSRQSQAEKFAGFVDSLSEKF